MNERWTPRVTVAAVIEQDGKFLFVEERDAERTVINQPAGHWDQGESVVDAVVREVREETTLQFTPQGIVRIYHLELPEKDVTYLRVCYFGSVSAFPQPPQRDPAIIATIWLREIELRANASRWRSPLVGRCVEDYLAGRRLPLDVISDPVV